ncbi:MAG: HAD-IA family hydrolase [Cyanobacteria bacterium M_surface_10_m1_298]|nr:HAD-IA family hydrolase [Cyanobacteria bacterium M_surface_10_m1_298]
MSLRPQGLLLDAMGTLIGLRQSVGDSYAAIAEQHGISADPETLNRVFPHLFRQAPPLAFPGLSGAALQRAEQQWWSDLIAACFEASGHAEPLPEAFPTALFEHFAEPGPWLVYPDVLQHLGRWREAGLKLAVVSNFDQRLIPLLAALGLEPLLDAVVVSSAVGAAKPEPQPLLQALQLLELGPEQVWHIGDSPEDEASAKAAGVRCLLIKRPKPNGTP